MSLGSAMKVLESPKYKLYLAGGGLVLLLALAPGAGWNAGSVARWLLAAVCVVGLGVWLARARRAGAASPEAAPRLQVVARTGLTARTGLALVEADGRSFLVAYGDGFAEVRSMSPRASRRRRSPDSFRAHLKRVSP